MSIYTETPAQTDDWYGQVYCHMCQVTVYPVREDIETGGPYNDTYITCPRCFNTLWVDAPKLDRIDCPTGRCSIL